MVVGFAPGYQPTKFSKPSIRLQNYQSDKLVVLLNSSDPTLHEQLMQNHGLLHQQTGDPSQIAASTVATLCRRPNTDTGGGTAKKILPLLRASRSMITQRI